MAKGTFTRLLSAMRDEPEVGATSLGLAGADVGLSDSANGPTRINAPGFVGCDPATAEPRRRFHQPHGFAARLGLAFALVAALTAGFAGVFASFTWATQFDSYVRGNLQAIADGVSAAAANAYSVTGNWGFATLSSLPQTGRGSDIEVQILDVSGQIVYDEADVLAHAQEMSDAMNGVTTQAPNVPDATVPTGRVVTSPIVVANHTVGTVRVWPYGNHSLLTARDVQLRAATLWGLAVAGLTAIIVASLAGVAYSRRLVKPIARITATAKALRAGDRGARTCLRGEDEISELGEVFDSMANAIEAEREQERRLTSDVAHELRTPLMAIQATAEAIEDGIFPADAEHLGRIQMETQRLTRLTNAILELSKLEAGTLTFSFDNIDLGEQVRTALDTHEALFDAAQLSLETRIDAGLTVWGDGDRLQQAVGNLLSNAARYTEEGGIITVTVRAAEPPAGTSASSRWAVVEVSDTGIGMAPADRANMFRRFWRADAARTRETGGLGVGLSISKEIIDRHQGIIEVDSEVGAGTTFRLFIPRG